MNEQELLLIIAEVQKRWGSETVTAIQNKIREVGVVDTGELGASITFKEVDGEIKFSMLEYGKFQDQGVNPQGLALFQTPFYFKGAVAGTALAIKDWASARGLNNWAVATNLQKYDGIKPKKFFTDVIASRIDALGVDINQAIADYMDRLVRNRQQNP